MAKVWTPSLTQTILVSSAVLFVSWFYFGALQMIPLVVCAMTVIGRWYTSGHLLPPIYNPQYIPFVGGFLHFAKAPLTAVREGYEKHGDCFTINMLGKRLTFLLGPEAHTVFFKATDDELSQEEVYKFMIPVFGKGVVYDAPPKKRLQQFRFLGTGLRGSRLKSYVPMLVKEATDFFAKWGDSGEVDILTKLSELTILTASRCLMGKEVRETMFEEVAELFHLLDKGITPLSVFWPHAPVQSHWKRDQARKDMVQLLGKVIRKKRADMAAAPDKDHGSDMLTYLVQVRYKDGKQLTDHEITGFFIALLFAGQHTSSITATWTTLFLVHNRDVLSRVIAEQSQALAECGGIGGLDFAAVKKMDLASRSIKESLRMFPPLILLLRQVRQARSYKGHVIPKGDVVVASPGVAMRLNDVFERPNTFDPDRWLAPPKRFDFIGFGGGMHACMGTNFAYLQIRVILTVLFQTYDVTPVTPELPEPDYTAMVVGPIHSQRTILRYKRRRLGAETTTKQTSASQRSTAAATKHRHEATKASLDVSSDSKSGASNVGRRHVSPLMTGPEYTATEVRRHNKRDDAWLIIDERVYDVTKYVPNHPGGDLILGNAGGDASAGFNGPQHPPHARTTLEQFCIGRLKR